MYRYLVKIILGESFYRLKEDDQLELQRADFDYGASLQSKDVRLGESLPAKNGVNSWAIYKAPNKDELQKIVDKRPLADYFETDISLLRPYRPVSVSDIISGFSLIKKLAPGVNKSAFEESGKLAQQDYEGTREGRFIVKFTVGGEFYLNAGPFKSSRLQKEEFAHGEKNQRDGVRLGQALPGRNFVNAWAIFACKTREELTKVLNEYPMNYYYHMEINALKPYRRL